MFRKFFSPSIDVQTKFEYIFLFSSPTQVLGFYWVVLKVFEFVWRFTVSFRFTLSFNFCEQVHKTQSTLNTFENNNGIHLIFLPKTSTRFTLDGSKIVLKFSVDIFNFHAPFLQFQFLVIANLPTSVSFLSVCWGSEFFLLFQPKEKKISLVHTHVTCRLSIFQSNPSTNVSTNVWRWFQLKTLRVPTK